MRISMIAELLTISVAVALFIRAKRIAFVSDLKNKKLKARIKYLEQTLELKNKQQDAY